MAEFEPAFDFMIKHEGVQSNSPHDGGGFTRYGIAQNKHPEVDVKNLTLDAAKDWYKQNLWLPIYERILAQVVANKIFDLAVNMGTRQAHVLVQRACSIYEDGIFGPKTLEVVNQMFYAELLARIKSEATGFYQKIVAQKPDQVVFLKGWLTRANA